MSGDFLYTLTHTGVLKFSVPHKLITVRCDLHWGHGEWSHSVHVWYWVSEKEKADHWGATLLCVMSYSAFANQNAVALAERCEYDAVLRALR